MKHLDLEKLQGMITRTWVGDVIPSLSGLVAIPALSPSFDPSWAATGYLAAAVDHVAAWAKARDLEVSCEVAELDGRSPLLLVDVPATAGARADRGTVLIYGHLDKQPALGDWSAGLGPWQPVLRDGRLYGRGAADDGYAGYAAITETWPSHAHWPREWRNCRSAAALRWDDRAPFPRRASPRPDARSTAGGRTGSPR